MSSQQPNKPQVQCPETTGRLTATAQQIADAAGTLADLAGNLETTAATAKGRY